MEADAASTCILAASAQTQGKVAKSPAQEAHKAIIQPFHVVIGKTEFAEIFASLCENGVNNYGR
jgi:hypothetical protein